MVDVRDPKYAEAIFRFVMQEEIVEDFSAKREQIGLSMAEYVELFQKENFENYWKHTFANGEAPSEDTE